LSHVFFKATAVHLLLTESTLDQPAGMLSFGIHIGFEQLGLISQGIDFDAPVNRSALTWSHGNELIDMLNYFRVIRRAREAAVHSTKRS
jgi:hypothetical protein